MKRLNPVLGIVTICVFLFYLTLEVSPLETDLQNLSSFGYIEHFDGKIFLTLFDTLSQEEIKTLQRLDSYYKLHIIEPESKDVIENPLIQTRGPP